MNTADYLASIDVALTSLTEPEAREFLENLTEQWCSRYADFQRRVLYGQPTRGRMTAWDYLDILSGLDQRAAPYLKDEIARWEDAARKTREFNARQAAGREARAKVQAYMAGRS